MAEELPAGVAAREDYNAEGRKLIASLGVGNGKSSSLYNDFDPVYKDPETGGKIFVGNESAARGPVSKLLGLSITHVVNCTCLSISAWRLSAHKCPPCIPPTPPRRAAANRRHI